MITSGMMAYIRRTVAAFLTDRCNLSREASTRGSSGEPLHTWAVVQMDVPCRVIQIGRARTATVEERGGAETMKQEYRLIVARDVELTADMRVSVGNTSYDIVRIETKLTDEAFHSAILHGRDA